MQDDDEVEDVELIEREHDDDVDVDDEFDDEYESIVLCDKVVRVIGTGVILDKFP